MTVGFQTVIDNIAEVLQGADGDYVARIHNDICSNKIRYVGDSIFENVVEEDQPDVEESQRYKAEDEVASYNFGEGVTVVSQGGWSHEMNNGEMDWTKIVYVQYDDEAPEADSHKLSFHVKFEGDTDKVSDAYALSFDNGAEVGSRN